MNVNELPGAPWSIALGQRGSQVLTNSSASGSFACVVAVTACTITSLTGDDMTGFANLSLPAGGAVFGLISAVTLTGTAILYKR